MMRIRPESFAFTLLLSALGGITPLSIDMGLPALSSIGQSLHVSPAAAGLTLSFFLVGFALGPIALGPLSDRFGRRPLLLSGCTCFALAGAGCAVAHSLPVLLFWRLVEGIGAGAGSTLSLAIVRDLFDGKAARVKLSYVGTVGTIAPMIAPTLGTIVLVWAGWRAIYGALFLAGLVLIVAVAFGFVESLARSDHAALEPRKLVTNYGRIFRSPICLGYALVGSLNFGCMFSYISSSPLVMIGVLGVSRTYYGWTFAATALGIMAGAFVNGRLSARGVPAPTLLTAGLSISVLSALSLVAVSLGGLAHLATILPLLVLNTSCSGLIGPNANQGVMHPMPDIAGVASAVMGSLRMVAGALAGVLIAIFFDGHTANAMACMMSLFSLASFTTYFAVVRPMERNETGSADDSSEPLPFASEGGEAL
jgi:DHA1 family bicyclomycin/chloramphenicol resistance-like MFS transporter